MRKLSIASSAWATPPSAEISLPSKSTVTFLRLTARLSSGSRGFRSIAEWRFRWPGRKTLRRRHFYPITTTYALLHNIRAGVIIQDHSQECSIARKSREFI